MKGLTVIIWGFILVFGAIASGGANLDKISAETGVAVATLQAERASTGLGWGGLEKAHLLANASAQSFDTVVSKFQGGEGWGKIAHDYGLNLGHVVSAAHRSSQANTVSHGKNTKAHGKSATNIGRSHTHRMSSAHGFGHRSSARSGFSGSHRMAMSHFGSHSMGSMGHGGGHHGR